MVRLLTQTGCNEFEQFLFIGHFINVCSERDGIVFRPLEIFLKTLSNLKGLHWRCCLPSWQMCSKGIFFFCLKTFAQVIKYHNLAVSYRWEILPSSRKLWFLTDLEPWFGIKLSWCSEFWCFQSRFFEIKKMFCFYFT